MRVTGGEGAERRHDHTGKEAGAEQERSRHQRATADQTVQHQKNLAPLCVCSRAVRVRAPAAWALLTQSHRR